MLKVPTTVEERSEDWQRRSRGGGKHKRFVPVTQQGQQPSQLSLFTCLPTAEDGGVETVPESQTKMQKPWVVGSRAHETLGVQWEMQRLWRAGDQWEMPVQRQRLWVRR